MLEWAHSLLRREIWTEAVITVVTALIAWFASRLYLVILDHIVHRWAARTASTLDDEILTVVRRPGALLVFLVGVYIAVHRYQFGFRGVIDGILFVCGVALVIYALIAVIDVVLRWYGQRLDGAREGETVRKELLPLADKLIRIAFLLFGLMVVFERFGISVHSILVTLGVGSLAIGLALQDTLANMFGGFTIMLDRPFRAGDRIQLQSGETGDVQSIGMRSTSVLMPDGNLLIIPNAILVKNMVINHSFPQARSRVVLEIGLAYGTDVEKAKGIMLQAAVEDSRVLADPPPQAFLKGFGDSALKLQLVCHARHFADVMPVTDAINTRLNERFESAGIRIPLPTRAVYLTEAGPKNPG
jgi:MscS family membrane protein